MALIVVPAIICTASEAGSVREIVAAAKTTNAVEMAFETTGEIVFRRNVRSLCTIRQGNDAATIMLTGNAAISNARPGDEVLLSGKIRKSERHGRLNIVADRMKTLRRGIFPVPRAATLREIIEDGSENTFVKIRAAVQDVYESETNPRFCHLILNDDGAKILATVPAPAKRELDPKHLQEALVEVCGVCVSRDFGPRHQIGKVFLLSKWTSLRIIHPPPEDPFRVPELPDLTGERPETITTTGRRRIQGRVLAVLEADRRILLQTEQGLMNVDMAEDGLPEFGAEIETVGFPATDLFRINLNRARWRPATETQRMPPPPPVRISARELSWTSGKPGLNTGMHGQSVLLRGIVRTSPGSGSGERHAQIESDGIVISVDVDSVPESKDKFVLGAVLDVSGTCFLRTKNWSPNENLPRADGFMIAVRTARDVTVVKSAPWWTQQRIVYVLAVLIMAITGILTWSITVKRTSEKRGRELFKEHIARATAELRVAERTRLSIELHDSLSQNLSGIALQIESVGRTLDKDPALARNCLTTATSLLRSCRDELRNCLYDLRVRALEATDIEDAVMLTVKPHLGDAKLDMRFNIARDRLSDTIAHAFLRIIRELVVNAVRHGGAGRIWIAGAVEQSELSFSVRDNGCGFDPACRADISTGHCGLTGIRERVRRLGGRLEIDSKPGQGTKIVVHIRELT